MIPIKRDTNDKRKLDSNVISYLILLLFIIGCISSFFAGMVYMSNISSKSSSERLDIFFMNLYETEILPKGEKDIQTFVSSLPPSLNETEQFELIADWVIDNFTVEQWELRNNPEFGYIEIVPNYEEYYSDPEGHIRTKFPCRYTNDPFWIAYYRTGACGELAALFAEVTNRTGTPTRVVNERNSTGWGHAWVEITRKNGELWFFDPTRYGEYKLFNIGDYDSWTGKTSTLTNPWGIIVSGVYDSYTNENVSEHYPLFDWE